MHQIWDQDHRDREVREDAVRPLDQGQETELGDGEIYQTADQGCNDLAAVDDRIVAVKYGTQFGLAFHPELDQDNRIHEMFLDTVKAAIQNNESAIK